MRYLILGLTLSACPAFAEPPEERFHLAGSDPATACDPTRYSDSAITISGNQIRFVESTCDMTNPTGLRDMPEGVLFDAVCSGEGEVWTDRMLVYEATSGLMLLWRGVANTYTPCP